MLQSLLVVSQVEHHICNNELHLSWKMIKVHVQPPGHCEGSGSVPVEVVHHVLLGDGSAHGQAIVLVPGDQEMTNTTGGMGGAVQGVGVDLQNNSFIVLQFLLQFLHIK